MKYKNLHQAMLSNGWVSLDARTHPRAYTDTGGQRYGTLEKDGVCIALSLDQCLAAERGCVMVYHSDQDQREAILQALIVDPGQRRTGKAEAALCEVTAHADACHTTLYLEPTPIADKPVPSQVLAKLYRRHGFVESAGQHLVMVRLPTKYQPTKPKEGT